MIDISKIGHNISSTNSVIIRLIQLGNYLIPLESFSYVLFLYSLYICIKFKKRIIFNFNLQNKVRYCLQFVYLFK